MPRQQEKAQTTYYKAGEMYEVQIDTGEIFRGRLDGVAVEQDKCRLVFYSLQDKRLRTLALSSLISATPIIAMS